MLTHSTLFYLVDCRDMFEIITSGAFVPAHEHTCKHTHTLRPSQAGIEHERAKRRRIPLRPPESAPLLCVCTLSGFPVLLHTHTHSNRARGRAHCSAHVGTHTHRRAEPTYRPTHALCALWVSHVPAAIPLYIRNTHTHLRVSLSVWASARESRLCGTLCTLARRPYAHTHVRPYTIHTHTCRVRSARKSCATRSSRLVPSPSPSSSSVVVVVRRRASTVVVIIMSVK